MDRRIHGESNVSSTAQRRKKVDGFNVHAGFVENHRSVGYVKQCSLVWSCVVERGWPCLEKGIRFLG